MFLPIGRLLEKATSVRKIRESKSQTFAERLALLKEQQNYFASFGITTAQDGGNNPDSLEVFAKVTGQKQLFLDLIVLPA